MAYQAISGNAKSPLTQLGWKSMGVLELTALPSNGKSRIRYIPGRNRPDTYDGSRSRTG
jgi:hypothetical protein